MRASLARSLRNAAALMLPFLWLQGLHAISRLWLSHVPPFESGTRCSSVAVARVMGCSQKQQASAAPFFSLVSMMPSRSRAALLLFFGFLEGLARVAGRDRDATRC